MNKEILEQMRTQNFKFIFLALFFFYFINSYSQSELRKVEFELYFDKNYPIQAGNLTVKNSDPIIGTQTDLSGKAELNLQNKNVKVVLDYLGPTYIELEVIENIDLIIVNLKRDKIIYYKGNKIIKKQKLKIKQ
ncbi:hypothetical protein FLJC2902T_30680 [Flavobacterium limnosediminis JC2902]|uniref:Uncharacterized protein n=1 Tax=Flavobacterium limnosediminis JC2902 TaxID=1341181 RepID=V6SG11_9FLAO|nr:hypothetical protein [Flavobacterium limnosediminis]ESU25638.1 hypothetical protein FLJC2902T_30680 [Flavobacterium limnosediminis JC2902]